MLAFLVAATLGLLAGRGASPLIWITTSVIVAITCSAIAIAGWSLGSVIEGLSGLLMFNAIAFVTAMLRRPDSPHLAHPSAGVRDAAHALRPRTHPVAPSHRVMK